VSPLNAPEALLRLAPTRHYTLASPIPIYKDSLHRSGSFLHERLVLNFFFSYEKKGILKRMTKTMVTCKASSHFSIQMEY
jgi:hypothetical protein